MKILTCGFAILDILAVGLKKLPKPGEVVHAPHGIKFWIGGHPINVSMDLRQLGCKQGDVAASFAVGDDFAGEFIRKKLEDAGIITFVQSVKEADTGRTIVLVLQGQDKSFIDFSGANLHLSLKHVVDSISKFSPNIFYLACGILGKFDYEIDRVLALCKSQGMITFLDIAPSRKDWSFLLKALKYVDIFHLNSDELRWVSGSRSIIKGLVKLHELGVKLPVVTGGELGAFLLARGKCLRQPSFKVRVIDPTGAGDAFCAGLIKYIVDRGFSESELINLSSEEYAEMLLFAQAAGAACVESIGTTTGVKPERIVELLRSQGEKVLSLTTVRSY